MSDEELAAHCKSKLDGALDELLARYDRRVRACARQMASDQREVEDLVQETFLRVISSLARFEGRSAFATWLYRIAHNTCIDKFRRDARQRAHRGAAGERQLLEDFLAKDPAGQWGDPEAQLEHDLASCYVGWLLSTLSAPSRQVIQLRLLDGRSDIEVAQLLGATPDAVKSRLRRARAQLRAAINDHGACPFCGFRYETTERASATTPDPRTGESATSA